MKLFLLSTLVLTAALSSCSTPTDPGRTKRVTEAVLQNVGQYAEKAAFDTITNATTQAATGEKVDLTYAATSGLFKNLGSLFSPESVRKVSDAWTGGKVPQLGTVAATAYSKADPQTADEKKQVVTVIANAFNQAAASAAAP